MIKHYERILRDTDERVKRSLGIQVLDKNDRFFGGFMDEHGLVEAKFAIYRITSMIAAYSNEESRWYLNEEVASRILIGLNYVCRMQHGNGLFDCIDRNFFSAPDTAFCVKKMLPCLHYLQEHPRDKAQQVIYEKLSEMTRRAAFGLAEGGFHIPSQRWVIASNLMECAAFFQAPELERIAQCYLNEGIDCNEDGEYTEKSSGYYNRINNEAMMTLSDCLQSPEYDEYAIRNLKMMMTYVEPDGSIFTCNSTRHDNGKYILPKAYYYEYLMLGKKYDLLEFLDMANYIFGMLERNKVTSPDILIHFMNHPELIGLEHESSSKKVDFRRFYEKSGIIRVQHDDYTYTLMKGKSNFLYFSNHSITIELKIGGSFCEHRAFKAEEMAEDEEGFKLQQIMRGWYYLPFKEKPNTSEWEKMNNEKREKIWGPNLEIEVGVKEEGAGIDIQVDLRGINNAPFRVEMAVTGADTIETEGFTLQADKGENILVKQGMVTLKNSRDKLIIGPAFGSHAYLAGRSGSEASSVRCSTIYFTDYTPFKRVIQIRTE